MVHKYVANCGVEGHDRLVTSCINYESGLVEKDCLFTFINFHGQYLTHTYICHKRRLQKILINFELLMNFRRFCSNNIMVETIIICE